MKMKLIKLTTLSLFALLFFKLSLSSVLSFEVSKLGVHILNMNELDDAKRLVTPDEKVLGANTNDPNTLDYDTWSYVTIPITFDDIKMDKEREWQLFFNKAKDMKIIPIVRLATQYSPENEFWIKPNKKQIIEQIGFLSKLNWPTKDRYIIVFNEVNHATEWGGVVDPKSYAEILKFTSNWAHTEGKDYIVLPAAMDLAAPNSKNTLEAFNYLSQMYNYNSDIFSYIDVWNSHSYPNPAFSSSPRRYGKNSLRGFIYELNFLKAKTGINYKVMITETGWKDNRYISRFLNSYYIYAMRYIWSDERVLAVTPFLLKGSPGSFSAFSFYDANNNPTNQFNAFKGALNKIYSDDK